MTNNAEQPSLLQPEPEQVQNPVSTGLDVVQLAEIVESATRDWKESDQVPVLLLRALCRLTERDPALAEKGFSAVDLQQEVEKERPRWARSEDKSDIASAVRKTWPKLQTIFQHKAEHLRELASRSGLSALPALDRREGGGTGNLTRYRLIETALSDPSPGPAEGRLATGDVAYICENVEPAGILLRAFAIGFEPHGWRRWLYLAGGAALLFLSFVVGLIALLALLAGSSTGKSAATIISTVGILWALWWVLAPLYRPLFVRVAAAPGWMQSIDDDCLLEFRKPPRHPRKALYAVRYRGTCPLCGGVVLVKQRGLLDPGTLAGFCEEAPKSHVFSFDHVLRVGSRLSG